MILSSDAEAAALGVELAGPIRDIAAMVWMRCWGWSLLVMIVTGCRLGGLDAHRVATSVQQPSNVAVYMAIHRSNQPVTGLTAANFEIYENGQQLNRTQTRHKLLDPSVAAVHKTLLLVDMSSVTDDASRVILQRGVGAFLQRVRAHQDVVVYAFDGSTKIHLVSDYAKTGETAAATEAETPPTLPPRQDPSRDLHGALIQAVNELGARLMMEKRPVRVGTIVVMTTGPDLAGRVDQQQVRVRFGQVPHQLVAIFAGSKKDKVLGQLKDLTDGRVVQTDSLTTVGIAFEEAASKVVGMQDAHYLLAYCSPARAGTRALRIQVNAVDTEGKASKASVQAEFDSTGFGPGCDPNTTPRFIVATGGPPAPPAASPTTTTEPLPTSQEPAPAREPVPTAAPTPPRPRPTPSPPPKPKAPEFEP